MLKLPIPELITLLRLLCKEKWHVNPRKTRELDEALRIALALY